MARGAATVRDPERRREIGIKGELMLVLLPTITVLLVLAVVQAFSQQKLLFASLASSAFLIYVDPRHAANSVRSLVLAQSLAAVIGFSAFAAFGPGYWSAAAAMLVTIAGLIVLDAMHPPAVSTALAFTFRAGPEGNLLLFGLALVVLVLLIGLQRASLWVLARHRE